MSNALYFSNYIVPRKRFGYDWWWKAPVESYNDDDWTANDEKVTHGVYIRNFYHKLKNIVNSKGFTIENEKQFKREISIFIYKLSNENLK
jgi:hypothetical protein